MSERPERCENCRFWQELPDGHQLYVDNNNECGHCRRYPPQFDAAYVAEKMRDEDQAHINESALVTAWCFPVTVKKEWCGEFQPKESGQPE